MWMLKAILLMAAVGAAPIAVAGLPPARDLAQDAEQARQKHMPIMVFYTSRTCPYCKEVHDLYLEPMHERGTYKGQVLFRVVEVTSGATVRDFHGKPTDHETFASREGAFITPIIRFYDHTGRELVPPIIGYTSEDFFAGELENAIETSIDRARAGTGLNRLPTRSPGH